MLIFIPFQQGREEIDSIGLTLAGIGDGDHCGDGPIRGLLQKQENRWLESHFNGTYKFAQDPVK